MLVFYFFEILFFSPLEVVDFDLSRESLNNTTGVTCLVRIVHHRGNTCRTLHLILVILHSLLTGERSWLQRASLSFSISPAPSPPLSVKHVCGVTVNPPRPIYSSTHHIPALRLHRSLLPGSLTVTLRSFELFEWSSPPVPPPPPHPQLSTLSYDSPSSITQSNMIAHFRRELPPPLPEKPKREHIHSITTAV